MERTAVMAKQVGGDHYNTHMGLQPWDIIDEYGLNYYEGNILKYLLREKSDRKEDLGKLIHYAEKELENLSPVAVSKEQVLREAEEAVVIKEMLKDTPCEYHGHGEDGEIRIMNSKGISIFFGDLKQFKAWAGQNGS